MIIHTLKYNEIRTKIRHSMKHFKKNVSSPSSHAVKASVQLYNDK